MSSRPVRVPAPGAGRREMSSEPQVKRAEPPSRLARQLALAHWIERQLESGRVESYAEIAAALGLTRARVSQIAALVNLAPELQDGLLAGRSGLSGELARRAPLDSDWRRQDRLAAR